MSKYVWREGMPKPPVDADTFGAVVEKIDRAKGGVTPADIVEEAARPGSPISAAFQWDNEKAADLFRREQARLYLRCLVVVRVKTADGQVGQRAWYPVRESSERRFAPASRIMTSGDLRAQVVDQAASQLESYLSKFADVLVVSRAHATLRRALQELREEADALMAQARSGNKAPAKAREVVAVEAVAA